jgi:uncharacterized protein
MRNELRLFPVGVEELLGWYVYLYSDPRDDNVFYVGKGQGDRVFSHLNEAKKSIFQSKKLEKILEIWNADKDVTLRVFRHGLTEENALLVEAVLIQVFPDAANAVEGHYTGEFGDRLVQDLISDKQREPAIIGFPTVLINIRKQWLTIRPSLSSPVDQDRLYDATRTAWSVQPSRHTNVHHAISVAFGIIRQVYTIQSWEPAYVNADGSAREEDGRWMFHGQIAEDKQHLIGKAIDHLQKAGAQNPIRWFDNAPNP